MTITDYNIRTERIKKGYLQRHIAKAMGVSNPTIAHWERLCAEGKIKPYMVLAVKAWLDEQSHAKNA